MEEKEYYGYVYLTFDTKENKIYIGQKKGKVEDSKNYFGSGTIIKRIIEKRGTSNLKKLILELCYSKEELTERETFYKYFYDSFTPNGYNIAIRDLGGDNWTHHPNKKEWGNKISKANSGKNNGMYGKTHTETSKKKMSDNSKGQISPMLGKKHSDDTKKKMSNTNSGENHPQYGKKQTEETINKRITKLKGQKRTPDQNEKNRKSHLGKKHSDAAKKKMSNSRKNKSTTWRKGISIYSIWLRKYGEEIAQQKRKETQIKRNETRKNKKKLV